MTKGTARICTSTAEFTNEVRDECDKGLGFVPLVAAGLSAPSGIPVVAELKIYLQRCIALALGINNPACWSPNHKHRSTHFENYRRWLPGRDQWPPFGGPHIIGRNTVDWKDRLFEVLRELSDSDGDHHELPIFQEAYGAMADWKSALLFLSRVRLSLDGTSLTLSADDPDIIDTFFLNVILGKRPALGHRMLARLASPMRMSPILTINFDDLIEQAFEELNRPLVQFDVHVDSGLPSHQDMLDKNSIVKLHGGRYGLRADYSLDSPPSETDCRHFVEYLLNRSISDVEWSTQVASLGRVQRHLLVVGCGAGDERILRFIQVASRRTSDLRVFWTAFSRRGAAKAQEALNRVAESRGNSSATIVVHHALGLLFLQMYQELTRSLPPTGVIFPYAPRLSVPPEWSQGTPVSGTEKRKSYIDKVSETIDETFDEGEKIENRIILCTSPYGTLNGQTTALAAAFHKQLENKRQAVWIDMDESIDTDDFFENLIHAVSRKAGVVDWLPVLVDKRDVLPPVDAQAKQQHSDSIRHLQLREIARLTNNPNRKWVLFLNARTGAGKNLPSESDESGRENANGWLDLGGVRNASGQVASGPYFLKLVRRLTGKDCPNVTVVLSCYDGNLVDFFNEEFPRRTGPKRPAFPKDGVVINKPVEQIVEDGVAWATDSEEKKRFLFAMCLTNRPRFPAVIWSSAFHTKEKSIDRFDHTERWLKELGERHIVRTKLGGFVWMHCDIRDGIRDAFREDGVGNRLEAELHQGLCEAYWRLFLTTEDAMAAFEAIYHAFFRVISAHQDLRDHSLTSQYLAEVLHLLQLARPAMLAIGFSKGVCRWLSYIRDFLVVQVRSSGDLSEEEDRLLKTICIETVRLQRDVAREVGENAIAARRHRELRARICDRMGYVRFDDIRDDIHHPEVNKLADGTETTDLLQQLMHPHVGADGRMKDRIWKSKRWTPTDEIEPLVEWLDSETHLATLGLAARTYEFSDTRYEQIYQRVGITRNELDGSDSNSETYNNCIDWLKRWSKRSFLSIQNEQENDRFQTSLGVTKALGRDLQNQLSLGQLIHLCERRNIDTRLRSSVNCFKNADRRHIWAAETMRWAHQHSEREKWSRFGYYHRREDLRGWYDERQRLDTQHGLVLAYLNDFHKAHRRLNEAESSRRRATFSTIPTEQAIIELHRAEVLTLQACRKVDGTDSLLVRMRRSMIASPSPIKVDNRGELDPSLAYLQDAWQALDRARRLLDKDRKNVWWTTWYFDLRLKLIELFAFDSILRERTVFPHLGLEAVPLGFPTLADELLDRARRMVRLDVFRFSRTVESYAHTLLALALWRRQMMQSSDDERKDAAQAHSRRQKHMIDMLDGTSLPSTEETAISVIRRLVKDRHRYDNAWPTTKIDDLVSEYVDYVLDRVRDVRKHALVDVS